MKTPELLRGRAAPWAITVLLVAALVLYAAVTNSHYPMREWMFFRYFSYLLSCAVFSVACLGMGHVGVRAALRGRPPLPLLEHTLIAFTLGVLLYEIAVFAVGLAQGYGTVFFFALPIALIAATLRPLLRTYLPALRKLRAHARRQGARPVWQLLVMGAGAFAMVFLYVSVMTPDNVQFDARWKHLALAEDFVVAGGVHRFEEGWIFATRAHFSSYLYTWAFAYPTHRLFDQMELSEHIEFTIFAWTTLLGIPVLVRRLVPRADPALVWVARFLFPGIFLYDSGLHAGADHIVAAFCIPAYLLTRRAFRTLDSGILVLLGAMVAAIVIGKETVSVMVVPGVVAALSVRWLMLVIAQLRGNAPANMAGAWWRAPAVMIAACVVWAAPHWLCNFVWYGDPLYPVMYKTFHSRPWIPDSAYDYEYAYVEYQMWRPPRTLAGVLETLRVLATYSFIPNDWEAFHGKLPIFGSLLTLLLPTALFMRRVAPIWWLALWTHAGIFAWYWVHHQDRYLQAVLPWMAALLAALIIKLWRTRIEVRAALVALLAFQVVWGGDVPFIPTHPSPIKTVADILAKGYRRQWEQRLRTQPVYSAIGDALPKGANVLMHENHTHLGIAHTSVSDWSTWQYGIDYSTARSPRDIYDTLKKFKVTHVVWTGRSRAWDALSSDLMFFDFALHHTEDLKNIRDHRLARMPKQAPAVDAAHFGDVVALFGCGKREKAGLYHVKDLQTPSFGPREHSWPKPFIAASTAEGKDGKEGRDEQEQLLSQANFVVAEPRCHAELIRGLRSRFDRMVTRTPVPFKPETPTYELWSLRKNLKAAPAVVNPPTNDDDDDEGH